MKMSPWLGAVACASALLLGGCASPNVSADARLLQRMDSVMRQATPGMQVSLRLAADQVNTGDAIGADIGAATGGYAYLFQLATDASSLSLVFPNAIDGANYVAPGAHLLLPRPNWRMSARGPAGVGHLLAVVSDKPLDLMALQTGAALGQLEVRAPYGAAMATLREVAR